MSAVQELMEEVDRVASERNLEVILAVWLETEGLPNLCCWGKLHWEKHSISRRLEKVCKRMEEEVNYKSPVSYSMRRDDIFLKERLTDRLGEIKLQLENLYRCGSCAACKYVPKQFRFKTVLDPQTFEPKVVAVDEEGNDAYTLRFIAEGGEGE